MPWRNAANYGFVRVSRIFWLELSKAVGEMSEATFKTINTKVVISKLPTPALERGQSHTEQ
jgi:hypothetical protein